jgi:hypothetical protein
MSLVFGELKLTPEELKVLIRLVPGWESKTSQEVLDALQEENIPFENSGDFTWKGLASVWVPETGMRFGRGGCKRLQDVLLQQGETWAISQLSSGMPLNDVDIQNTFNFLDQVGLVPGARHLAREVKRNISLLEQARIKERIEKFQIEIEVPSLEEITACVAHMKLVALSELRIERALDRVQAYREAWTEYIDNNGLGLEPEL